ncbi:MAG: methylmalonyl Co-A mutase-associated GTPase MeaB [Candidatus Promineifilaceae bacterium]|nr:methylmalonyl Co-A mutase-associated GTPase MeaB [Candidatus Promineifilaceae bacterium]
MVDLLAKVREGNNRAVARVITMIENEVDAAHEAVSILYPYTGKAHVIGITGPPGSGKSTLVNALAKNFSNAGYSIGIIAVDPSSPFSGGALLGDRVRMHDLAGKPGVFIRSMASRGSLGGLARSTWAVIKVLDAAGYDIILVETVGAGQIEVDIASAVHTTLVVEAPGMGDEVQSIKAGILEIADDFVVNKADRPGALRTVKALEMMLHMGHIGAERHHGQSFNSAIHDKKQEVADWPARVFQTVASEGRGIEELAERIHAHRDYLIASDEWIIRERNRSRKELSQLLQERFMKRLTADIPDDVREAYIDAVAARELDPYTAVDQLFNQISIRMNESVI